MSFQKCDWSVDGPQVGESELTDICLWFWKITECFNGANVETRRLFQGWLCLQGISTLRKWLWLIDGSIILWRARPTLSWSDINYDVVGAATTRRCQIVKKKKMLQMYSLKSTGEIQAKVGLCLIIVTPLFFPSVLFPCRVFSRHKRGALLHIPLQAFQLHHCTSPPELPGRYLSIRIYCVCVCAAESEREGSMCVISDWTFFCSAGLFQLLLWRILLLLLRSEEAGYLPDSDCAEVITVLCWKEGEREAEGGWGEAVWLICTLFLMETLTSGCFTCSQLKWKATNLLVNQLGLSVLSTCIWSPSCVRV